MKELIVKAVAGSDDRIYIYWTDDNNNCKYIGYYNPDFKGKNIKIQIPTNTILKISETKNNEPREQENEDE